MKNLYLQKDFAQKLDSTFLKYRGRVYWCRVDNGLLGENPRPQVACILYNLWDLKTAVHSVNPMDSELDISSIRLGFINNSSHKMGMYVIREPVRRTKQGVCLNNISVTAIRGHESFTNAATDNLFDKGAVESLNGKYPSIKRACELMVTSGWSSVSVDPGLCLTRRADANEYSVYYKGKNYVGVYDSLTNILNIPSSPMAQVASHILAEHPWVVV